LENKNGFGELIIRLWNSYEVGEYGRVAFKDKLRMKQDTRYKDVE